MACRTCPDQGLLAGDDIDILAIVDAVRELPRHRNQNRLRAALPERLRRRDQEEYFHLWQQAIVESLPGILGGSP